MLCRSEGCDQGAGRGGARAAAAADRGRQVLEVRLRFSVFLLVFPPVYSTVLFSHVCTFAATLRPMHLVS